MKKYYDLYEDRLVAELNWQKGYGSEEDAKKVLTSKFREVSKKEFNKLGKEYTCNE